MYSSSQGPGSPRRDSKPPRRSFFPISCAQALDLAQQPDSHPVYPDGTRPLVFTVVGKVLSVNPLSGNQAEIQLCDFTGSITVLAMDCQTAPDVPSYLRVFIRFRQDNNIMCMNFVPIDDKAQLIYHDFSIAKQYISRQSQAAAVPGEAAAEGDDVSTVLEFMKEKGETSPSDLSDHFQIPITDAQAFYDHLMTEGKIYMKPSGKYVLFST
ncbi:hypothetical protein GEMRC1_011654 [Eukaryota sp. GEM-RC1]